MGIELCIYLPKTIVVSYYEGPVTLIKTKQVEKTKKEEIAVPSSKIQGAIFMVIVQRENGMQARDRIESLTVVWYDLFSVIMF